MKATKTMFRKVTAFIAAAVMLLTGITISQINNFFDTSITVSAADNGTGNYRVNTGAGLNIRSGPGTGNGILGAATNGTQFTVTQTQNGWGYGSVKCTNGTRTGWACLQYCTFLGRNEPSPETPLENGAIYWISPACATGSVIDISGVGYNDGANTHLWSKVGGTNQKNQQFKAVKRNNYYIFEAVHSGKALDVSGATTGYGQNIHQWTTHGGDNQCWYLYNAGNGYYYIRSKMNTGFSLDVNGAGSADGTNIHLWESNSTNAQRFKFTKVTYVDNSSYTGYVNTSSQPLNLRSNANTSSSIIASMPKGSTVTVLDGKRQTNGFYRVSYGGRTGYASAQYISFTKPSTPQYSSTNLSQALYKNSSARITCGFDGYTTTRGRHEGIDFSLSTGSPIYSLTDGIVTRVYNGYRGSNGLSTIAIYYAAQNKTVIYLHSQPCNVWAGKSVSKGEHIGYQDWRGVSSSGSSHTHVEVRNGRQSYAAKSVNDYNLENPNPNSFWNSLGYNVR